MICKKCSETGSITLRKEHVYCDNCFILNVSHKFRACLGKSKVLSLNEKILICLTGGLSSAVLLDLVFNSLSQENHKKLRIIPFFLHLTGFGQKEGDLKTAEIIIKQCEKYNFDVYIINTCIFYLQKPNTLPNVNSISEINDCSELDLKINLKKILRKMTPTSTNDIERKIRNDIFLSVAKMLNCKFIFTAETTTTLAINLLSNLVIGRGSQVENDIGFCDKRDENVIVLRPMKNITEEELHHYRRINNLIQISNNDTRLNSLQNVIKKFVLDLQENFPATVYTVCKTAEKIGTTEKTAKKCQFCKSTLGLNSDKLTADEAINFSKTISNCQPVDFCNGEDVKLEKPINEINVNTMFPFIDNYYCYCCSKNCLEGKFLDNFKNINQ